MMLLLKILRCHSWGDNSQNCEVNTIVNNISIQNDDIQNPTLTSLPENTLEEAAELSFHPLITKNETFENEQSQLYIYINIYI